MPKNSIKKKPYQILLISASKRRLNIFSGWRSFETISFSTQYEFEKKLKSSFNLMKKNAGWLNKDTSINIISVDNTALPRFAAHSIFKITNQNPFITEIKLTAPQFSQKEKEEIVQIGLKRQKEKRRREARINYFFLLGAINGVMATFGLGLALPLVILKIVGETLLSALVGYLRQKYLDFSVRVYSKNKKFLNPSEKLAFEYGTKSLSTLEWLKSFFRLSTYLNPLAFAAGLEHALEKNDDIIANLLNGPLTHVKRFTLRAQINQTKAVSDRVTKNLHSTWIHFDSELDLKLQLQSLVNEYKTDFTFTTRSAKLKLSKENGARLPSYVSGCVQNIILDNQCIQDVACGTNNQKALFSQKVMSELKADSKHNAKEIARRRKSLFSAAGLAATIGVFFNAIIPFALLGTLFNLGRQSYLDKAVKTYNTKNKISKVRSKAEQKALLYGVKAGESYKELLYSWGRKEAYTHFNAFEAGKELSIEGNTALVKELKRFKVK